MSSDRMLDQGEEGVKSCRQDDIFLVDRDRPFLFEQHK
jgi:hypothetical protein